MKKFLYRQTQFLIKVTAHLDCYVSSALHESLGEDISGILLVFFKIYKDILNLLKIRRLV